jgi:hypothetical protein
MSRTIAIFGAAMMLALIPATGGQAGNSSDAAKSTGVVVTSFTAGVADPNGKVPAINGVPGAGVGNWDIPIPLPILKVGFFYNYQMSFYSISYSGNCKATYKLTQVKAGKTATLDSGTIAPTINCTFPSVWLYSANSSKRIPSSPGAATLTGTLATSKGKVTVKVPMIIQQ